MEVKRCGDRELWVMTGVTEKDVEWQLPFFADPYTESEAVSHYRLEPACFMNSQMTDAAEARMKYQNQGKSNVRLLSRLAWSKMAFKAPGINPEYYLKWETFEKEAASPVDVQPVEDNDPDLASEATAFCKHVANTTQIVPYGTMKLVYRAIMTEGLVWLLEKGKPLNLGFVRLVPLPYRPNWKQILLAMFPASASYFRRTVPNRDPLLHNSGFWANLYNTKLGSIGRSHHIIHWGLECIEQKSWWKAVEQKETSILSALGPVKYAQYFRNAIKRAIPSILDAYTKWVDRIMQPCAALDSGRMFSSQVLRPWVPKGRVTPAACDPGACVVVPDEELAELIGPEDQGDLREENVPMRRLPGVLPPPEDVRECEGGTELVENGPEHQARGVSLPDGTEEPNP